MSTFNMSSAEQQAEALAPAIEAAIEAGRDAYIEAMKIHGDPGAAGSAWVAIEVTPKNKALIRACSAYQLGSFDNWRCYYSIHIRDLGGLPQHVQSISVQQMGLQALVTPIRAAGFDVSIDTLID